MISLYTSYCAFLESSYLYLYSLLFLLGRDYYNAYRCGVRVLSNPAGTEGTRYSPSKFLQIHLDIDIHLYKHMSTSIHTYIHKYFCRYLTLSNFGSAIIQLIIECNCDVSSQHSHIPLSTSVHEHLKQSHTHTHSLSDVASECNGVMNSG